MNQIAIGETDSWTVIEGASIAAPFRHAVPYFTFSSDDLVEDFIEITLAGTPAQISTALATLEKIIYLADLNDQGHYDRPQYIRYHPEDGLEYYYTTFHDGFITGQKVSYKTHYKGSIVIQLHYTRDNCFYGRQIECFLDAPTGDNLTGGVPIFNHTDFHITHGNSVLIQPALLTSPLPHSLRIEITNTYATSSIKDLYIGLYHHPTYDDEGVFFLQATDWLGGTQLLNVNAIGEYCRRLSWAPTGWSALASCTLIPADVDIYDGHSFRPILHLFNAHAYTDLFFRFKLMAGVNPIYTGDMVYADPNYQYVMFPPIELPPHVNLREQLPASMDLVLYAYKSSGAAYQIDFDQVMLFPVDYSASFSHFRPFNQNNTLIDDNFRQVSTLFASAGGSEMQAHVRRGSQIFLRPGAHNRLFFVMTNANDQIDIMRTATVRIYQRARYRLL